jgi:hypothetical protein
MPIALNHAFARQNSIGHQCVRPGPNGSLISRAVDIEITPTRNEETSIRCIAANFLIAAL